MAAILSFAIWGGFPIYWRLLSGIGSFELLNIRLILTACTCLAVLPLRGTWPDFRGAMGDLRILRGGLMAAILLAGNWLAFIWAVNSGNILESSLGYFLCPLVTVMLGYFVEKEPLRGHQWWAVLLATLGVTLVVLAVGRLPMAALVITFTWSGYGLMKKRSRLGPVVGLGMETSLLSLPAAMVLLWMGSRGSLALPHAGGGTLATLALSGFITAAPLLLFAYAVPRIRLSTVGMGQYLVPSCHFALALFFGESVPPSLLGGFGLIWAGLLLYAIPGRENESG